MTNTTKIALLAIASSILITALTVPIAAGNIITNNFTNQNVDKNGSNSNSQQKDQLELWLDELADYECLNCPPNFEKLDANGLISYGCLQFQEATFVSFIQQYNLLPAAEGAELLNLIHDCDFQKKVAKTMFMDNPANAIHWFTSVYVRGLGEPPVIVK